MKKLMLIIITICLLPINILATSLNINSNNAILINLNDESVLYEKNINDKTYIASLTKIMTAIVVLDNVENLNSKVKLQQQDLSDLIKNDVSVSTLSVNKEYTYMELLYGLMLPSGGDCANGLARIVGGNVTNFVKMMNEKAKVLGMNNTSFANPIGLDDDNNYSTVSDLSIMFKYAIKNETLLKLMSTMTYKTNDNHNLTHTIQYYKTKYNLNMDYLIGGKTGYEVLAGYCLASLATYNDIEYMLITTNATYNSNKPNHFLDAQTIYKHFMDNYNYHIIIEKNDIFVTLETLYAKEKEIDIKANKDYSYYINNDYDKKNIKYEYNGINTITTDMKKGQKIGTINVYYFDDLIDNIDVYLQEEIHFSIIAYLLVHPIIIYSFLFISLIILVLIIFLKKKIKKIE